ncbi:hypothetical protein PV327_005967 [Microctonus hyperodae]|uniref:Gustatory receptor n=1 Tax=Microctonus hyperodae TaxID=165561 RepID=A0AA39L044_MICHY|nr:hypothetical protein PV327_005967 [Microctonus hyperodae]
MSRKKWQPKNVVEALWLIQLLSWLFSLGIIHYPIDHSRIGLSIFYTISTVSAHFILLIHTILMVLNKPGYDSRAKKVLERTSRIDNILEELNVPLDYRSIYIKSLQIITLWIIIFLTTNMTNLFWLHDEVDLLENIITICVLLHTLHGNAVVAVQVCIWIELMECRFKKVNQILLNILDTRKNGHHEWPEVPMIMTEINNPRRFPSISQNHAIDTMRITKQIHLELCCICNEISRIFGIQIATGLASSFIIVTGLTFTLYIIMVNSSKDYSDKISAAVIIILWLMGNYLKIFHINKISAKTVTEWKKTGEIIHELEIACKDNEYRDDIRQFSLQILQNPLSFNACGLVTLGYSLVHGFVGSVTTYVIILVQMYNTPE